MINSILTMLFILANYPSSFASTILPICNSFQMDREHVPFAEKAWSIIKNPPEDEDNVLGSFTDEENGFEDFVALGAQLRALVPNNTQTPPEKFNVANEGVAWGIALAAADPELSQSILKYIESADIDSFKYDFAEDLVRRPSGPFKAEPFERAALLMTKIAPQNNILIDTALNHLERRSFHELSPAVYIEAIKNLEGTSDQTRLFTIYQTRCLHFNGRATNSNELENLFHFASHRKDLQKRIDVLMEKIIREHPETFNNDIQQFVESFKTKMTSMLPKAYAILNARGL